MQQTLFDGQREIDEAWVRTYHETGRLIVSHILLDKHANYGAQVYRGLAARRDLRGARSALSILHHEHDGNPRPVAGAFRG